MNLLNVFPNVFAVPTTQTVTDTFMGWFLYGMFGVGGWFLFFLLTVGAIAWLFYDSSTRKLPALGWKMATILIGCLLIPTIIYRFTMDIEKLLLGIEQGAYEIFFYLGILGGIGSLVSVIGYYVTFKGLTGCGNGHVYDSALPSCPECRPVVHHIPDYRVGGNRRRGGNEEETDLPNNDGRRDGPRLSGAKKVPAWLLASNNHQYQLNIKNTTIGRSTKNDIVFSDRTVSSQHARIIEDNHHFKIVDLGSSNGTFINGHKVREAMMLEHDDEIRFGDETIVRFVSR